MSTLRIHATAALATKLGGFTKPVPEPRPDALILDTWYAHIVRHRRPRALLMNPATLLTVTLPLAPAKSLADRVPGRVAAQLMAFGAPPQFIDDHIHRLHGGAHVVRTDSKSLLGLLNQRMQVINRFRLGDDEELWEDLDIRLTEDFVLADIPGPRYGPGRLALAFETWERTGTAAVTD